MGAVLRGTAARARRDLARNRARASGLGAGCREPVDLLPEPVHPAPARLRARGQQHRIRLLPRATGDPGHARVRRVLRDHAHASRRDRPHPGDQSGDGGARPVDRDRRGEGAPDPDRDRRGRVPPARRRIPARRARPLRPAGLGVRPGLVPEGRHRVGRRARAQADQGPGRAACGRGARRRAGAGAPRAAHGPGARLCPGGPGASRDPVPSRAPSRRRRRGPGLSRDRRLPRRVARRGRPASGARVDGDARPARDDEGRAGRRPRAPRRERLDGRAGGRRRARRLDAARRRGERQATLEPVLAAGRAVAEDNSYDALRPRWRALLDGFVSLRDG